MSQTVITKAAMVDDYDLPVFLRKAADAGEVSKAELGDLLNRRVAKLKLPAETREQAYVRLLVNGQDEAGAAVFKIYRQVQGLDEWQTAASNASDAVPISSAGQSAPLAELTEMAEAFRKFHPLLSSAQAFARMAETPEGVAILKRERENRLGGT